MTTHRKLGFHLTVAGESGNTPFGPLLSPGLLPECPPLPGPQLQVHPHPAPLFALVKETDLLTDIAQHWYLRFSLSKTMHMGRKENKWFERNSRIKKNTNFIETVQKNNNPPPPPPPPPRPSTAVMFAKRHYKCFLLSLEKYGCILK